MSEIFKNAKKIIAAENEAAIILLHGYGADGEDLLQPFLHHWQNSMPNLSMIAPNAPIARPLMGYEWFSMYAISEDEISRGVLTTRQFMVELLESVMTELSLPVTKIMLLGFSQGTIVALDYALHAKYQLAGVVGFSGALAGRENLAKTIQQKPPILLAHGTADPVVPVLASETAARTLKNLGCSVELVLEQNLPHMIGQSGLNRASLFVKQHLFS